MGASARSHPRTLGARERWGGPRRPRGTLRLLVRSFRAPTPSATRARPLRLATRWWRELRPPHQLSSLRLPLSRAPRDMRSLPVHRTWPCSCLASSCPWSKASAACATVLRLMRRPHLLARWERTSGWPRLVAQHWPLALARRGQEPLLAPQLANLPLGLLATRL